MDHSLARVACAALVLLQAGQVGAQAQAQRDRYSEHAQPDRRLMQLSRRCLALNERVGGRADIPEDLVAAVAEWYLAERYLAPRASAEPPPRSAAIYNGRIMSAHPPAGADLESRRHDGPLPEAVMAGLFACIGRGER